MGWLSATSCFGNICVVACHLWYYVPLIFETDAENDRGTRSLNYNKKKKPTTINQGELEVLIIIEANNY